MMNSPVLLLSQYVCAKKANGGFWPGRIEGKESEHKYCVAFSDYTHSVVDEKDILWLGFYNLGPHMWDKSPVMQPMRRPNANDSRFYNGEGKRELDEFCSKRPDSLRTLKQDLIRDRRDHLFERESCPSDGCRRAKHVPFDEFDSVPSREEDIRGGQTRSSVLRLNRKALSEEVSQRQHEPDNCSPVSRGSMLGKEDDWKRLVEVEERRASNTSQTKTAPYSPPYPHCDLSHSNMPCLTPPTTPGSQPPPLFICNPYDTAAFGNMDAREWMQMDRRDIGGGKRKRDNMKKCRKVYGIDNRELWCTQCKWKKACSRFQMGHYGPQQYLSR